MDLLDYQQEAVTAFIESEKGKLIKAPAGSGKSIISYKIISLIKGPVLLCSAKYVLYEHLYNAPTFIPEFNIEFYTDKQLSSLDIVLITPEQARRKLDKLITHKFSLLIFDESHLYKNCNSKRCSTVKALCRFNENAKKLLLTATPCPETIGELHPQIEMITHKSLLRDKKYFNSVYRKTINVGTHWKDVYIKKEQITRYAAPYMFIVEDSRVKLPDHNIKKLKLPMLPSLKEHYLRAKEEGSILLKQNNMNIEILYTSNLWIRLLQLCSGLASDPVKSLEEGKPVIYRLDNIKIETTKEIANNSIYPVIIWGTYREELKWLKEAIPSAELIMGGTKNGDEIISNFKKGKFKILIANPKCIGTGMSLEVAGTQIATSINASCCLYEQTICRNRRITQDKKIVRYELIYKDTLEERLYKKVGQKYKKQKDIMLSILKEEFYG